MKINILLITSVFCSLFANAQDTLGDEQIGNMIKKAFDYVSSDYTKTQEIAKKALNISIAEGNVAREADSYHTLGIAYYYGGNNGSAIGYFNLALELELRLKDTLRLGRTYNCLGVAYIENGEYQDAITVYEKSLYLAKAVNDYQQLSGSYNNLGVCYYYLADYDKTAEYYFQALHLAEDHNDQRGMGISLANIGSVYSDEGELDRSIEYFEKAIAIFVELGIRDKEADTYTNIGESYDQLENDSLALLYFLKGYNLSVAIQNDRGVAYSVNNLGEFYLDQGEYEKALAYLNVGRGLIDDLDNPTISGENYLLNGKLFLAMNNKELARSYFEKAYQQAIKLDNKEMILSACKHLSKLYAERKNYERAYQYHAIYAGMNDSLMQKNQLKAVEKLRLSYESDKKEQELVLERKKLEALEKDNRIVRKDKRIANYQMWSALGVGGLASLLLMSMYYHQKRKRVLTEENLAQEKQVATLTKQLMEKELSVSKAENKELQGELSYKSNEVQNLASHIVRKNEVMDQIKEELKSPINTSKLTMLVQTAFNLDTDKEEFDNYIKQINELFYKKLKENYSELTENDLRLCGLLKMKLSSKEISVILNISDKSVEMARYRLRKKMRLSTKDSVVNVLLNT